jgi:hypothetical protein
LIKDHAREAAAWEKEVGSGHQLFAKHGLSQASGARRLKREAAAVQAR